MKKINFQKIMPYLAAVLLFLLVTYAYFPDMLEGNRLSQHDMQTWKGGSNEIKQFKEETGEHSQWTNSMFGGMPSYLITNYSPNNIVQNIYNVLDFNHSQRPASLVFLYLFGFFIALILFGVDPWLAIVGALAFAFSSYFFIIIEAGHITKVAAIAFMAPIIAGVHHAYNKNKFTGAAFFTVFLALQLLVNHLQITYYTMLVVIIYLIFQAVETYKSKLYSTFAKASGILVICTIIAVSTNFAQMLVVYDYGKDSIRGKSELTSNKANQTSGLDRDYATAWSYGKMETFNLLIPNLVGGASTSKLSENSKMYEELVNYGAENPKNIIKSMPTYWGPQPFTSGPVYIGALMIFLFVMGLFLVKGKLKWWLLAATILSILLAWGKNFMFFTDLFLDYFPGYNKFRTVSMILVIAQFTVPLLGILAVKEIVEEKVTKEQILKSLLYSLGILGGIILILLIPGILSFTNASDAQNFKGAEALIPALESDRASIFRMDAFRSLAFILIGAAAIFAFSKKYIKVNMLYVIIGIAVLVDLWTVDKRFLNSEDFVSAQQERDPFKASEADKFILKDNEKDFRVLNFTVSTFNDASTSFFHKSIGGYSGAKMRRYQELIEGPISKEMSIFENSMQSKDATIEKIQASLARASVLNMLNTKYLIVDPNMLPVMNYFRMGNAWFVENVKQVANADEEIKAVDNFSPEITAIVDVRFKDELFNFTKDTSAVIKLIDYKPNKLIYETSAKTDQLAVFSEIYYAKGWNAYIDGKLSPHFRANYILRAMKVPAGQHKIEFKFEPAIWKTGNTISLIGSILFVLFIIGGLGFMVYQSRTKTKEE